MRHPFACAALAALLLRPAAADHRFYLASQHDFEAKRGFYLNFENAAEGPGPCRLSSLRMILGGGDGKQWRFAERRGDWQVEHTYRARAELTATTGRLLLDGVEVGRIDGGYVPARGPLTYSDVPGWASDPADYAIQQTSISVSGPAGTLVRATVPASDGPPALALFAPQQPQSARLAPAVGQALVIEAEFRISRYPEVKSLAPFIDAYGQSIHSRWPGKVRSDADLKRATADEAVRARTWTRPVGIDRFGGWTQAGWREEPTGYFRVTRRNGVWWLVSPEGNPCFYTGMNSLCGLAWERTPVDGREFLFQWLPPRTGAYAAAWNRNDWGSTDGGNTVAIQAANMLRKYGPDWQKVATTAASRRLRQWAFAGGGKWGSVPDLPCTPVLAHYDIPNVARHPDIFDADIRDRFRETLRKQIAPQRRDPLVLGWSLGNEYDEIVTKAEIQDILRKPAATPAKREMIRFGVATLYAGDAARAAEAWRVAAGTVGALMETDPTPSPADLERMRLHYADAYYKFIYTTVKEIDPDHLYLGFWIVPGWWENADDWRVSAPYCDVIGYDRYALDYMDAQTAALVKETRKPILCGEFSFPPTYRGTRGFGVYPTHVADEVESGDAYARWIRAAAADPYCVGGIWFQYRDQPLTGRGPGKGTALVYGEHYAFGVVDLCDRPKVTLVERMRKANLAAQKLRQRTAAAAKAK